MPPHVNCALIAQTPLSRHVKPRHGLGRMRSFSELCLKRPLNEVRQRKVPDQTEKSLSWIDYSDYRSRGRLGDDACDVMF